MYKGLIFDMDGTMVDNMMVHHRAWQRKLSKMGMEMSIEEVMAKIHGVNEEILERLFGDQLTSAERKQHAWEKEEEYRNIYRSDVTLIAGLSEFLDKMKSQGMPMAIGTAAPPENANFILDTLDLRHYFKGIFHSEDVTKGKPDPEVFELAADSLGLKLTDCLVFEDSITGAEAANRGGAKAVIVTTTHKQEEFQHYDHIAAFIENFSGFDLSHAL